MWCQYCAVMLVKCTALDMCPMSEAAEVHKTSFNTEVPTDTYHTYPLLHFKSSSLAIDIRVSELFHVVLGAIVVPDMCTVHSV